MWHALCPSECMSATSAQCRSHAAHCRELASRETFLHQAFLDLAWKWEKLADELEQTQALIDNWRRERLDLPTRPEAIRRLVIEAVKAARRR